MAIPYLTAVPPVDMDGLVDPWNCESVHGSTRSSYRHHRPLVSAAIASQHAEDQVEHLGRQLWLLHGFDRSLMIGRLG
jgi:hypothetical protein